MRNLKASSFDLNQWEKMNKKNMALIHITIRTKAGCISVSGAVERDGIAHKAAADTIRLIFQDGKTMTAKNDE